jgi:beta-glucosidase
LQRPPWGSIPLRSLESESKRGRPLIINTQLNESDAFVAAWLPGTEGAGITDVLFGDYGFIGKLPVTWPNAVKQEPINSGDGQTGLFPFGYGITP